MTAKQYKTIRTKQEKFLKSIQHLYSIAFKYDQRLDAIAEKLTEQTELLVTIASMYKEIKAFDKKLFGKS